MPVKLLTSGGGGVNLVPSSSIASDVTVAVPSKSGTTVLTDVADNIGIAATGANYITMSTNGSERVRIDSSGNMLVGTTSSKSHSYFEKYSSSDYALSVSNTSTSLPYGIEIMLPAGAAGNTTHCFLVCRNSTPSDKLLIYANGNVVNTNNSYGALSDRKLKENIVDTSPKLDDLCKVKVRNFNLIDDENKLKQIGVVAQELEEVFPSMVDETPDYEEVTTTDEDGNEKTERVATGTTTKSVKYSVFVPMLIKAVQELSAQNKELTQRIEALEYTKQGE